MPGYYRPSFASKPPARRAPRRRAQAKAVPPPPEWNGFAPSPANPAAFADSIELSLGQVQLVISSIAHIAAQKKTVFLDYTDRNGRETTREVEAYEIRGNFLHTRCRLADAPRAFELSRIRGVREGQSFEPAFPVQFEVESDEPAEAEEEKEPPK